jgi:hypothetical protein
VFQHHASHTQTQGPQACTTLDDVSPSLIFSSNITASKALDDLIDIRLFREENQTWIEKAVITRIWVGTTNSVSDNSIEQLQELFDTVAQNSKLSLSAPATHAAQTVSCLTISSFELFANGELAAVMEESRGCIQPGTARRG